MIVQMFALYDEKVAAFLTPFPAQSVGHAVRIMEERAQDPNFPLRRHPQDFTLYCIGSFDDASASLKSLEEPSLVSKGNELVRAKMTDDRQTDLIEHLAKLSAEEAGQFVQGAIGALFRKLS